MRSVTDRGCSISELADQLGTTVRALRHYEKLGLLQSPRTAGNWRVYGAQERARAEMIVVLRKAGVPIASIRKVIASEGNGWAAIAALLQGRILEVRRQLSEVELLQSIAFARSAADANGAENSGLNLEPAKMSA